MNNNLKKAVEMLGGQHKTAALMDVTQPTVWYWLNKSKRGIPAEYCAKLSSLTKIDKSKLRPDLFGVKI